MSRELHAKGENVNAMGEILRAKARFFPLLIVSVWLCSCHKVPDSAGIAEAVAKMPCFSLSDPEKDIAAVEDRLDLLKHDNSQSADQALVMLMGYYLGEHNHEQLMIEIVRRGKRMRPLLAQEIERPASISTCAPPLERQVIREDAKSLISAIDKGERWD